MPKSNHLLVFLEKYLYTAFGALNLLTFGLLRHENRTKLGLIAEQFGWQNPKKQNPLILPFIDPQKKFPNGPDVKIFYPEGRPGNVSLLELLVLNTLVQLAQPKTIFEIGTFDGRTALNLAANAPDDAKVYTIDLPKEEYAKARENPQSDSRFIGKAGNSLKFYGTPEEKKIIELRGNSLKFDFSPYRKKIDFIFIDGGHTYDFVSNDTRNALNMIKDDGIIAWHDYKNTSYGVTKTLNDLYAKGEKFKNLHSVKGTTLALLLPDNILELF